MWCVKLFLGLVRLLLCFILMVVLVGDGLY